jgi:hypothetical protein
VHLFCLMSHLPRLSEEFSKAVASERSHAIASPYSILPLPYHASSCELSSEHCNASFIAFGHSCPPHGQSFAVQLSLQICLAVSKVCTHGHRGTTDAHRSRGPTPNMWTAGLSKDHSIDLLLLVTITSESQHKQPTIAVEKFYKSLCRAAEANTTHHCCMQRRQGY